ncbi:hypothetical protein NECAME_06386 [Necator americanus]|uniref:Uncharacterized protein n=1 Tax=Necator americanus TaxID=51031 RepID=W2TUF4_NECAM|nr:hypothetical protein NECAME_06386 [Necator americanus]ETN85433.1 hypothetical protein NECAME_06386 [Necator americanus]
MPKTWKMAFFKAFSKFPNIHFLARYTGEDVNVQVVNEKHPVKHQQVGLKELPVNVISFHILTRNFGTGVARKRSKKYENMHHVYLER